MSGRSEELSGRVALITGAASGIGRAAALRFAEAGAMVMCADIDSEGVKLTAELVAAEGGKAASLQLDVSDEVAVEKSLQQTIDSLGGFDILFNNAGVGAADFDLTLDVNLRASSTGCSTAGSSSRNAGEARSSAPRPSRVSWGSSPRWSWAKAPSRSQAVSPTSRRSTPWWA